MKIEPVVSKAFYTEWAALRGFISPGPFARTEDLARARGEFSDLDSAWDRVFDFDSIQKVVDHDLVKREGRELAVHERYHRSILRFLSQTYAQRLYLTSDYGKRLTEEVMRQALDEIKLTGFCPIYPCQRRKTQ